MRLAVEPAYDFFQLFYIGLDARRRHFANTDALFGRVNVILAVAQHGDNRYAQRIKKTHEFSETLGIFAGTIRDHRQLLIETINFRHQ